MIVGILNANKIKKINYECSIDEYGGTSTLKVFFEDNSEEIEFNSEEDTNENWKYDFDKALFDFAKYFTNITDSDKN
jgi:hypothetical protein